MDNLIKTYCDIDEFCQLFLPEWKKYLIDDGLVKRHRASRLSIAEIMTILIGFYLPHYRNFKHYYLNYIGICLKRLFPQFTELFMICGSHSTCYRAIICLSQNKTGCSYWHSIY